MEKNFLSITEFFKIDSSWHYDDPNSFKKIIEKFINHDPLQTSIYK